MNHTKTQDEFSWSEIGLFAVGSVIGALLGVWGIGRLIAAMQAASPGFWFVSRASGIVAYVLLWASTAWGISLSSKGVGGLISAPLAYALHTITSWLVIGFSIVHGLALLGDKVVPFTVGGLVIPFTASYQPLLSGIGTLDLYIGILVSITVWKKRIGFKAWHTIHMLSYLMFVGATVHGVLMGTDTTSPWMEWTYILAGASVLFLTLFRVLTARGKARGPAAAEGRAA